MALSPATRLGPYEIIAPIGAGGMGEVYRARDTRLDRIVAIKVLPADTAGRPEARQRLEREARAVSSLNHPHICVLYDVGHQDGTDFLVMEYLEGETLAARLVRGPLPVDQALQFAIQIAGALADAHKRGVHHRDLKPGNIMLTKSGAKLLDFGLAKWRSPAADPDAPTLSELPGEITRDGAILGTLQYMAPEQLDGKECDARSDIFSFGVVLYEMLTGRKAFHGKGQASVISAILTTDPAPISALQPGASPALDRLVRRCLAKDPDDRWQSAHDVKLELQDLDAQPLRAAPSQRPIFLARPWAWLLAGALAVAFIWALARRTVPSTQASLPASATVRQITSYTGTERDPAVSPDGRYFAFVSDRGGQPDIWVRQISGGEPVQVTRDAAAEANPVYAPDGESIYYSTAEAIWRIGALGGTPRKVVDGGREPSLTADGSRLAFLRGQEIFIAKADGTSEKKVCDARGWQGHLSLSPDGQRVAFTEGGLFEMISLQVVGAEGGKPRRLADIGFGQTPPPVWLPDSRSLVFERSTDPHPNGRASDLWIVPAEGGLASRLTLNPSGRFGSLRISGDGRRLVATLRNLQWEVWKAPLGSDPDANGKAAQRVLENSDGPMWIHRAGPLLLFSGWPTGFRNLWLTPLDGSSPARQVTTLEGNNSVTHAALSPDGSRLAFTSLQTANAEIWTMNTDGSNPVQLTHRPTPDYWPAWTKDGKWIAFGSEGPGPPQIWKMPSNGGEAMQLTKNGGIRGDWSPVENQIVYAVERPGKPRLEVSDFDGKVLLSVDWSNAGNTLPVWSPDGRRFTAIRHEGPVNDSVWIFDAASGDGRAAVKFPGRFHMIFRACWTPDGRSIIVNRVEAVSHIVMLEDFWHSPD